MRCYDEAQDFFEIMLNEQRAQTAKVCGSLL